MKYRRRKYQILFVILISIWGLTVPTYALFYSLEEMDVFSGSNWEDPGHEELLANIEKTWVGSGWISRAIIFPPQQEILNLFQIFALVPLPIEKTPTLRC